MGLPDRPPVLSPIFGALHRSRTQGVPALASGGLGDKLAVRSTSYQNSVIVRLSANHRSAVSLMSLHAATPRAIMMGKRDSSDGVTAQLAQLSGNKVKLLETKWVEAT